MRTFLHLLPIFLILSTNSIFGQLAPNFTVTATDGNQHSLHEDYTDQGKTVVIEIMFTTCPPCNSYAPYMEMLYDDWGSGEHDVQFFTITNKSTETTNDMIIWGNQYNHSFPGVGANGGALGVVNAYTDGTFGFYFGTPTFIVIAPDRTVQFNVGIGTSGMGKSMAISQAIVATGAKRPPTNVEFGGFVKTLGGELMSDVNIELAQIQDSLWLSDSIGTFDFEMILQQDSMHQLVLSKEGNPLNGVTTYDMVLITKHILSVKLFDDPYKEIAGDVNGNGTVSTSDLVKLRKLILFIDLEMDKSWRFVDGDCNFNNENCGIDTVLDFNPAYGPFDDLNLLGIKIGDVNNSASGNELQSSDDRQKNNTLVFSTKDQTLETGSEIIVPFKSKNFEDISAYQSTIQFDQTALQFIDFEEGSLTISKENFNLGLKEKGVLTTQWFDIEGVTTKKEEDLFFLKFKVLKEGQLSDYLKLNSTYTKAEAYDIEGEALDIQLDYEMPSIQTVNISPNPTNHNAQVAFSMDTAGEVVLEVFNAFGKREMLIQHGMVEAEQVNEIKLPIANLSANVYFVKISSNGQMIHSQKLIKI